MFGCLVLVVCQRRYMRILVVNPRHICVMRVSVCLLLHYLAQQSKQRSVLWQCPAQFLACFSNDKGF
jgi:hypothetical protein